MLRTAADSCAVTTCTQAEHAHLAVSGEVDMAMRPLLSDTLRRVSDAVPQSVYVDLTGVTFAGSALVNFLFEVRRALPESSLVLCRPPPMTRMVLRITDVTQLATVCDDMPACCR